MLSCIVPLGSWMNHIGFTLNQMFIPYELWAHTHTRTHTHTNNEDKLITKANQVRKSHSIDSNRASICNHCRCYSYTVYVYVQFLPAIEVLSNEQLHLQICTALWQYRKRFCVDIQNAIVRGTSTFRRIGTNWIPSTCNRPSSDARLRANSRFVRALCGKIELEVHVQCSLRVR